MAELAIELLAVGDELLMGMTLDTNSHSIAGSLAREGFRLKRMSWVADKAEELKAALEESWERSDIVIVTGGLGPTCDDITRPVIASFFNDTLERRADIRESIRQRYQRRGITPSSDWEIMTEFPLSADPIPNSHGAAPGIHYIREGKELFAIPGVPTEMRGMLDEFIIPKLRSLSTGNYRFRIIKTAGTGESHLAELIGDPGRIEPVGLAFLPSLDHGVTLRLSVYSEKIDSQNDPLDVAEETVVAAVKPYIYARQDQPLESVIIDILRERGFKLGLAESCTGGMIATRFVSIPGSSDVFDRGLVTYSNKAKIELLNVPVGIIDQFGAVSRETAQSMAEGLRENSGVDIALSVTGIAGPGGGSEDKPVGTTFIGIADHKGYEVKRFSFAGNRDENRRRSAHTALMMLYRRLAG